MKRGDLVHIPEEIGGGADLGVVRNVYRGSAVVCWLVSKTTYMEDVEALTVLSLEKARQLAEDLGVDLPAP